MNNEEYNKEKFSKINQDKRELNAELFIEIEEKIKTFLFNNFQKQDLIEIALDNDFGNKNKVLMKKMENFGFNFNEEELNFFRNKDNNLVELILNLFQEKIEETK